MTQQLETALQEKLPLTILRRREVQARTGLSCSTLYERVKRGQFPPAIRLGQSPFSGVGWIESEITAWIKDRISQTRQKDLT